MTILLSIPVTVARALANLVFGTNTLEQNLFKARAHAEYLAIMG